ncbi:MAG: CoB--CoM heterodisulfide reductase iron-sulfur subunit A family protein [Candidatus Thorarchaeota archaeon]|nr:CoB--CoM heterodisulfide reductase iron-sulfur subunit A family protein [Candidatus Thorarchaeota archaeon]
MTEKKPNAALVIGGGVAGMQAALDIANQGFKVYLVERTPSIGGRMAQIDKTFPTLDCSACILTPKLSEVSHHPHIELLTYSEVGSVTGVAGDFHVRIRRKARYVREDLCSGCGDCAAECPVEVPNEFDMNIGFRKAIYVGFPQATPNVFTVDKENCIDCGRCVKVCERKAIDMDMKDKTINIHVGAIIVATGFELFDVSQYPRLGYGHYQNVIHAMEFERLINAAGPTHGHLVRLSDGKKPKSIGFIQCVGARDVQKGVPYCSRVCCMYSIKNAVMALEHDPKSDVWVYYADIRAFGKGFEEFYEMAKRRFGVKFIRGRVAEVMEGKNTGNLVIKVEDTESTKVRLIEHDLIVISPGVIPSQGMDTMATKMGIEQTDDGYIKIDHSFFGPTVTKTPGVFVCGCADGPKDIPDSVSAGSAAAMKATIVLSKGES